MRRTYMTRNIPERVWDTIRTFPKKGTPPGLPSPNCCPGVFAPHQVTKKAVHLASDFITRIESVFHHACPTMKTWDVKICLRAWGFFQSGSEKGIFRESCFFQQSPCSKGSRDFRDSSDSKESPECGKTRRVRPLSGESRDSRESRDARDSGDPFSETTSFVMTSFSDPGTSGCQCARTQVLFHKYSSEKRLIRLTFWDMLWEQFGLSDRSALIDASLWRKPL